jgi:hypothetical protein
MKTQQFQAVLDRVRSGDAEATDMFRRVLQPVMSRKVRKILQDEEFESPLGREVQDVLAEVGMARWPILPDDIEPTARAVAHRICGHTVARLRSFDSDAPCAAETILA